jgi:hypothetical protein
MRHRFAHLRGGPPTLKGAGAVDRADKLIYAARAFAAAYTIDNATFEVMSLDALRLPDRSVDGAISQFGFLQEGDVAISARELVPQRSTSWRSSAQTAGSISPLSPGTEVKYPRVRALKKRFEHGAGLILRSDDNISGMAHIVPVTDRECQPAWVNLDVVVWMRRTVDDRSTSAMWLTSYL